MPVFIYRAKNLKGEEDSGILEAENRSQLARVLRQKGYFLLWTEEEGKKEKKLSSLTDFALTFLKKLKGVSLVEKLFFTRNLEVMIKTGVPLTRALNILASQAKSQKFKEILKEISQKILKGENLSQAVANFPEIFPQVFQETLKVGEETGKLEESLRTLSLQMEREHNLKSKIKTAMVYPLIVLSLAIFIGILMFIFAIPKLKLAFQELKVELPFTTQLLLSFSDFLIQRWPLFLVIMTGGALGLGFFLKQKKKRGKTSGKIILTIPLISKMVRQINSALTLRTLSSLLSAGVPIVRALEVSAGSLTNFYFKESLKKAAQVVQKGKKLSQALLPYQDLYSPMVLEMIKVGEETGETVQVLAKLADFYEKEITASLAKLSSAIEPFLILVIGAVVGFFAISMMQPMFSLMKGL